MRVIAKRTLITFCDALPKREQASAWSAISAWHQVALAADWSNFAEVKRTFNTADWIGGGKVVFDVGGNKYRIVCLVGFTSKRLFVLFVGTHAEYDAVDVARL